MFFITPGIGIDLVSITRIERIYRRYPHRFLNKIFSDPEKEDFKQRNGTPASLAARFAAKEAVLKALGCGIGPAALHEVEIIAPRGHQPRVRLHGAALEIARRQKITAVALSMTHEPPFACAAAVVSAALPGIVKQTSGKNNF